MASSSKTRPRLVLLLATAAVLAAAGAGLTAAAVAFDENYVKGWGRVVVDQQGTEANITMDQSSGGGGFHSKTTYGSGLFRMRMKLPSGYTAGVVTTFYLISQPEDGSRDEVDLEFLGAEAGAPVTLQTNIVVGGRGGREQRLHLWFDPAAGFHDYAILWNPYQLVVSVDGTPVRVLRNLSAAVPGYDFPAAAPAMLVRASVWDGSAWATGGGRAKVDWSKAPFTAAYRGFGVDACAATTTTSGDAAAAAEEAACGSPGLWWNGAAYWNVTGAQRAAYEEVRAKYMSYDYCADAGRFPNRAVPVECGYA